MSRYFHIFCKMLNATLAFLILALTSSSVPPVVLTILRRYVKDETARIDSSILAITSRELVAAEAHYHKSCYRDHTRENITVQLEVEALAVADLDCDQTYSEAGSKAYQMLFNIIRKDLFSNPQVNNRIDIAAN